MLLLFLYYTLEATIPVTLSSGSLVFQAFLLLLFFLNIAVGIMSLPAAIFIMLKNQSQFCKGVFTNIFYSLTRRGNIFHSTGI